MIYEEFEYPQMEAYLDEKIDILIAGTPNSEDRSSFFYKRWKTTKEIIILDLISENDIKIEYTNETKKEEYEGDIDTGVPEILECCDISNKNILVDLSSLNHILIMYVTKILISEIPPKTLFASYIRPQKYKREDEGDSSILSDKILGVRTVPGYTKREKEKEILCSFIGFEGYRLKAILEYAHDIGELIPIVAFPSGSPEWYNITMWHSMDLLMSWDSTVIKCHSDSIFEAIEILKEKIPDHKNVVFAPIGTRPHSMACAIYSCNHSHARIIYDYAIEKENRTEGISEIKIYYLTTFLKVT